MGARLGRKEDRPGAGIAIRSWAEEEDGEDDEEEEGASVG
jgi:hypothetical protein